MYSSLSRARPGYRRVHTGLTQLPCNMQLRIVVAPSVILITIDLLNPTPSEVANRAIDLSFSLSPSDVRFFLVLSLGRRLVLVGRS